MTEYRQDDTPTQKANATKTRRSTTAGRGLTILYSAFVAGVVAFFFSYANDSDQRKRSIKNCNANQNVVRIFADVAKDISEESPDKAVKERWSGYEKTFRAGFPPNGKSCEEIFPPVDVIPFIG